MKEHTPSHEQESDEVVVSEDTSEVFDEASIDDPRERIAKLKKELSACRKERQEYLDGWQRSRAEILNFRKQLESDRASSLQTAERKFLLELIAIVDTFDRAFADRVAWEKIEPSWRKGIESIYDQMLSTLKSYGVERFSPKGKPFNPQEHESVTLLATKDAAQDNIIVDVLNPGYKQQGTVLRPAQVSVAHFSPEA